MRVVLCLFVLMAVLPAAAQRHKKRQATRVFLDHADELMYDEFARPGVQIVKGRVRFRYDGTVLTCDSAYYNQEQNTFDAFGHVHIKGSKGASLSCGRARYSGTDQLIEARQHVVLRQPGRVLYTDSLNYDRVTESGTYWGEHGGRMVLGNMTISSIRGEYFQQEHKANAYDHVVVRSPKYVIHTNTLNYDTRTREAHVVGPSTIHTQGNTIKTSEGYYYPATDRMTLIGYSTITSKERDISGDNLKYNSKTGESEGHGHVVVVDKKNKRRITGDYLKYNSTAKKGEGRGNVHYVDRKNRHSVFADVVHYTESSAIAYGKALAKDFSQKDTLFVHADTIRMRAYNLNTDSVFRKLYGIKNVRAYRTDVQAVCDLLVFNSKDTCLTMYRDPIAWNANRQVLGDSIKTFFNDSTIRETHVMGNALSVELMPDSVHYNQVSSKKMMAFFVAGKPREAQAVGQVTSVFYPQSDKDSTLVGLIYAETDTMRMFLTPERRLQKVWMPKTTGTMYPMTQIPPNRKYLPNFQWYDYIRPKNKHDLFRVVRKGDVSGKAS